MLLLCGALGAPALTLSPGAALSSSASLALPASSSDVVSIRLRNGLQWPTSRAGLTGLGSTFLPRVRLLRCAGVAGSLLLALLRLLSLALAIRTSVSLTSLSVVSCRLGCMGLAACYLEPEMAKLSPYHSERGVRQTLDDMQVWRKQ